jgi:hypothetical protein
MTTPTPPEAAGSGGHEERADAPAAARDPVAVSPAIGPLPPIYVPSPAEQASTGDPLSRVIVGAARLAAHWATRRR